MILSYIFTVAVLCPKIWSAFEPFIIQIIPFKTIGTWVAMESTLGYSFFRNSILHSPKQFVRMNAIFVTIVTNLFKTHIHNRLRSLHLLVELSNWCTDIQNSVLSRSSAALKDTDIEEALLQHLEIIFYYWYDTVNVTCV